MKFPIAKLTVADNEFLRSAEIDIKNVLSVTEVIFAGDDLVGELIWGNVE